MRWNDSYKVYLTLSTWWEDANGKIYADAE